MENGKHETASNPSCTFNFIASESQNAAKFRLDLNKNLFSFKKQNLLWIPGYGLVRNYDLK